MRVIPISAILSLLCLTSCFGPPPGKGPRAAAGFHAAAPIIGALERFRQDRGRYPKALEELVPRYVHDSAAFDLRRGREHPYPDLVRGFDYRREAGAYTLMFAYSGPGMNRCWYDSRSGKWESTGYY